MLPKIAWVLAPLALYGAFLALLASRGRWPGRLALNVHTSLLLLAYLLTTAGLGIFWVANQQLPVFDWHYLFGYATLLLVSLHLVFNFPLVLRWFRRDAGKKETGRGGPLPAPGKAIALILALGLAYFVGMRQASAPLPPAGSAAASPAQAVERYHEASSESRASVFRRAPGVAWGDAPPPFKRYEGVATVALASAAARTGAVPGVSDSLRAAAAPPGRLSLAQLGPILHLSAGVTQRRGGHALRAAPSSGALFPSELYLLARDVQGLAPGVYHYDPEHHRLHVLGPLPRLSPAPQAAQADAVVVLSAVFRRTGYKYHNRAYRYALADAGHLLENLRVASHGAGLQARLLAQFDDALAASAIGVDGVEEGVLALMAVGGPPQPASAAPRFLTAAAPAASTIGVTGIVHGATSLRLPAQADARTIALPPPQASKADLHATILKRRSARRFDAAPVPLSTLSSMLADMIQPSQLSAAVDLSVVVERVEGLAPGVYRYGPGHVLRPVRAGAFAQAARSAALAQDVIGEAAVVLVLSAARDAVLADGARGYRHVFLETGLLGERFLLGAVARGLAACPVGAFYDDEAAALIGLDPRRDWVLHFAALGLPAS